MGMPFYASGVWPCTHIFGKEGAAAQVGMPTFLAREAGIGWLASGGMWSSAAVQAQQYKHSSTGTAVQAQRRTVVVCSLIWQPGLLSSSQPVRSA